MRAAYLILLLGVCLPGAVRAQETALAGLPVEVMASEWSPLQNQVDLRLQRRLEARLRQNPVWRSLMQSRRLAVGVVDMTTPSAPRYAAVNGNEEMYAASLPKIAILLAAEQAIEDGDLALTPEIDQDLHAMIQVSNNAAATRMIDLLGFDRIASTLKDPRYQLYDVEHGGGLWVGKRYAKTGQRHPDELRGLSHAATVMQVSRFYYLAATGRLVSWERSRHMLQVLSNPGINHKFVAVLRDEVPKSRIFRKSGTWRDWHADSVLVWGNAWRRFILVGLVEDPRGEQILRDIVPIVEDLLRSDATAAAAPRASSRR